MKVWCKARWGLLVLCNHSSIRRLLFFGRLSWLTEGLVLSPNQKKCANNAMSVDVLYTMLNILSWNFQSEWIASRGYLIIPTQNFTHRLDYVLVHLCFQVKQDEVEGETLKYMNRLSDFLFTLARHAAKVDNKAEHIYVRPGELGDVHRPPAPTT